MCLLAVLYQSRAEAPLIVAANRDEYLERPAVPMSVLQRSDPRVLGGRDERAGGTWLAVNEHGVVAGLTNTPGAFNPAKRSRGELPLLLARHRSAAAAAEAFGQIRPDDYSAAWLLLGDPNDLFYLDLSARDEAPLVRALPPGLHVLENAPLESKTSKTLLVRRELQGAATLPWSELERQLRALLASHEVPDGLETDADSKRPVQLKSPCVHAGPYGTRSSEIIVVEKEGAPRLWFTGGPPCQASWSEATALWTDSGDG